MFKGFRQFILRGNVVDLAVGVMVGAAFNSVVSALVKDLITPFVAALVQKPDFSKFAFTIHGSVFLYGDFVNTLVSFLITAAAAYYFVVVPVNKLSERIHRGEETLPSTKKCPECMSDIPIEAKRCPHCTSVLTESSSAGSNK